MAFSVKAQIFPESEPMNLGEFPSLVEAMIEAHSRFSFGVNTWVEQDGITVIPPEEIERRYRACFPFA